MLGQSQAVYANDLSKATGVSEASVHCEAASATTDEAGSKAKDGSSADEPLPDVHRLFADTNLPVYVWSAPASRPEAIVIGLHGGAMHGRAFKHLAAQLVTRNYWFVSIDMRGYGKAFHQGTESDRTLNFTQSMADIREVILRLESAYPDTPIVCLGESLGANLGLLMSAEWPNHIDGLIAINPFSSARIFFHPQMVVHLVKFIIKPSARLNLSPYLKNRLSSDRQQTLEHLRDPLARNRQSIFELGRTIVFNLKGKRMASTLPASLRVLFIVGAKDRLCSVKGAKRLFKTVSSADKTLVVFQDQGHLMVETSEIAPEVLTAIWQWLDTMEKTETQMKADLQVRR
ncbi:MAG: lysophospholipase [Candidatus Obscuribacterales bacterium]|nr:lysophospholipase [Candidatus Obscuribacterales bacterium]